MFEKEMIKNFLVYTVSKDYTNRKKTMIEVIEELDSFIDKSQDQDCYKGKIETSGTKLNLLIELITIKKLKDNRKDLLLVTQAMMTEIEKITRLAEEEE